MITTYPNRYMFRRKFGKQRDVIQINDAAAFVQRGDELLAAGVVRGEHNRIAGRADAPAQNQFGDRTAIEAKSHIPNDAENMRIRKRFNCKIFLKPLNVRESLLQSRACFADTHFVVEMKRRPKVISDVAKYGKKTCFEVG